MNRFYIDGLIKNALLEDVNNRDISSECLFAADHTSRARFAAKQEGVLCGIEVALRVFELLDETFRAEVFLKDGAALSKGDVIAEVSGRTLALLQGERTALNLLQHMSGVATLTAAYVRRTEGKKAKICDTRKTLPGLRPLQKYAVACGGGKNHRFNLSDAVMLKDNHIDAAGSIAKAVAAARAFVGHTVTVEVETRSLAEVRQALEAGADIIMLDNMDTDTMAEAVKLAAGRAVLEASGGITLQNVAQVAGTGVDYISVGALTHSARALDISMKFVKG